MPTGSQITYTILGKQSFLSGKDAIQAMSRYREWVVYGNWDEKRQHKHLKYLDFEMNLVQDSFIEVFAR